MYVITSQRSSGASCAAYDGILFDPIVMMWKNRPGG